jgi:hypothetical protein
VAWEGADTAAGRDLALGYLIDQLLIKGNMSIEQRYQQHFQVVLLGTQDTVLLCCPSTATCCVSEGYQNMSTDGQKCNLEEDKRQIDFSSIFQG